jgi:hypothetical protein
VARAVPMVDYYIDEILGGRGTLEEDRDKLREAVAFLCRIGDAVERNLFIKRVAETLNVDEEVLKAEVGRGLPHAGSAVAPLKKDTAREVDRVELNLIHMILEYPDRISVLSEVIPCLATEELKILGERLVKAVEIQGGAIPDIFTLVNSLEAGPVRARLLDLLMGENPYSDNLIDRLMTDTISKIRERDSRKRDKKLTRRIKEAERAGDQGLNENLVAEKNRILREEKDPA